MKRKNVIWCVAGVLIAASVAIVAKTVFGNAATTAAVGAGEASAAGAPMGSMVVGRAIIGNHTYSFRENGSYVGQLD